MTKKIAIIGSGFSGLSAAAYSAKLGNEVHVFEKNSSLGGARKKFPYRQRIYFRYGSKLVLDARYI